MSILVVFLYALVVVLSLLLIGIVLIQPAKSGGMGAAFGGIGESVFGGKAGSHLTKATVVMTALFFVLTLALAALIGHGVKLGGSETAAVNASLSGGAEKPKPAAKPVAKPAAKPAAKPVAKPAAKPAADKK